MCRQQATYKTQYRLGTTTHEHGIVDITVYQIFSQNSWVILYLYNHMTPRALSGHVIITKHWAKIESSQHVTMQRCNVLWDYMGYFHEKMCYVGGKGVQIPGGPPVDGVSRVQVVKQLMDQYLTRIKYSPLNKPYRCKCVFIKTHISEQTVWHAGIQVTVHNSSKDWHMLITHHQEAGHLLRDMASWHGYVNTCEKVRTIIKPLWNNVEYMKRSEGKYSNEGDLPPPSGAAEKDWKREYKINMNYRFSFNDSFIYQFLHIYRRNCACMEWSVYPYIDNYTMYMFNFKTVEPQI